VGLSLANVDPRTAERAGLSSSEGALITDVAPGSPAERAQLAPGMVVVEADRKPVTNAQELAQVIRNASSGAVVLLRVEAPGGGRVLRALRVP
jgi:serine protease Do